MATTDANQIAPVDRALLDVRKMLAHGPNMARLESLLGRYMPIERFCGSILVLCRQNPDLLDTQKTTRASLLLGVMRIAQWQLSPDPALGQAWLIPRKGVACVQLGWKGCLALAYRHPLMGAVRYNVVAKQDRFVWEDGRNWRLEHEPSPEGWPASLNDIVACWTILELRTGFSIPMVKYLPDILRHKARGQGPQVAWATDPAAMALKTTIADACRRGPFEGEAARPFALDAQGEAGKGQPDDGSIDIDYSVTGENGDEPKGPLAKFKDAHREPSAAPRPEPLDDESADDEPDVSDPINGSPEHFDELLDEALHGEGAPPATSRLSPEAKRRIRDAADRQKLDSAQLEALAGGSLDLTSKPETEILAAIRDYKAPKSPGRKRS